MASNKRTAKPKKTISERERRVRQMVAYFIYYWGGIIDIDSAAGLCFIANHLIVRPDNKLMVDSKFLSMEVGDTVSALKILMKLGTTADLGNSPQFVNLGNDKLACKELPKEFYESFFSPEDKRKLDWALAFHLEVSNKDMLQHMKNTRKLMFAKTKPNPPAKPWEGFDLSTAEAEAERLRKERMATLPKFPR